MNQQRTGFLDKHTTRLIAGEKKKNKNVRHKIHRNLGGNHRNYNSNAVGSARRAKFNGNRRRRRGIVSTERDTGLVSVRFDGRGGFRVSRSRSQDIVRNKKTEIATRYDCRENINNEAARRKEKKTACCVIYASTSVSGRHLTVFWCLFEGETGITIGIAAPLCFKIWCVFSAPADAYALVQPSTTHLKSLVNSSLVRRCRFFGLCRGLAGALEEGERVPTVTGEDGRGAGAGEDGLRLENNATRAEAASRSDSVSKWFSGSRTGGVCARRE